MILPTDFTLRTRALLGDDFALLERALQQDAPVSIRINKDKKGEALPPEAGRVPWCETGYYLPERISFTFDPLFHAGAYYVQEAASMFLEQVVKACVHEPVRCLDLCAAPGGKSTHLCSILPENSLLVSNEVIRSRANVLVENLTKWGNPHLIVTRNDPEEIGRLTHFFDLIVADVPCSGEGMFRKDAAAAGEWSLAKVGLCAARQRRIIQDVWEALKPGGLLIYSTCTYNTEENEENIQYISETLGGEALSIPLPAAWPIAGALRYAHPVYRFFPHQTKGEGFFLSVVRKTAGEYRVQPDTSHPFKEKRKTHPSAFPSEAKERLLHPERFHIEQNGGMVQAFPLCQIDSYTRIAKQLRLLSSGLQLGEVKGKDFLPAHSLAMSTALRREAFASIDLCREDAIRYLRKETLTLSGEKGYLLVTYKGLPLGFAKQLDQRANNLYPPEWRIRSNKRAL
jgi:16S rRNA C967 or C1407 C5-methylase (RsmB/RsmF family)/NOL1/NOP2/fmu family ribosome biogenesis protein